MQCLIRRQRKNVDSKLVFLCFLHKFLVFLCFFPFGKLLIAFSISRHHNCSPLQMEKVRLGGTKFGNLLIALSISRQRKKMSTQNWSFCAFYKNFWSFCAFSLEFCFGYMCEYFPKNRCINYTCISDVFSVSAHALFYKF